MIFRLSIDLASVSSAEGEVNNDTDASLEIAQLLKEVARRLETQGNPEIRILDINGNHVGNTYMIGEYP